MSLKYIEYLLTSREKAIVDSLIGFTSGQRSYETPDRQIRTALLGKAGVDEVVANRANESLALLVGKILSGIDNVFDQKRNTFFQAGETISAVEIRKKLDSSIIHSNQDIEYTFAEAWQLLQKIIMNLRNDEGRIGDQALVVFAELEKKIVDTFLQFESRANSLTFEQALQMRFEALAAVCCLIFDVAYGHLGILPKVYHSAKEKYVLAMMAIQLYDDVFDVIEDLRLDIGNVFAALLRERGELQNLSAFVELGVPPSKSIFDVLAAYAENSYRTIYFYQQKVLNPISDVYPPRFILPPLHHTYKSHY